MARVTSKLQVTVPKAIADQFDIHPGDDIEWIPVGDAIRVEKVARVPHGATANEIERRLELFDLATARQSERQAATASPPVGTTRGWRRDDLYDRDRPR
jgi:AbrB family looped-hinge helix DNA binding protein